MTETNIFNREELHHNCLVQILFNSQTGEISTGWRHDFKRALQIQEFVCQNLCKYPSEYKDPDDLFDAACRRCGLYELLEDNDG